MPAKNTKKTKRLSKGQRTYIRRVKQAARKEANTPQQPVPANKKQAGPNPKKSSDDIQSWESEGGKIPAV